MRCTSLWILALTSVVLVVVLAAMSIRPVQAQVAATIDDPEAYAVYAAVLDRLKPRRVVLLDRTGHAPWGCRVDETAAPPEWRPTLENYRVENAHEKLLHSDRDLGASLLSLADAKALLKDATSRRDDLFIVSAIGFNATKTLALISTQERCQLSRTGQIFCGKGGTALWEKSNGRWIPSKANACAWTV